jgi:hypothetical protein
MADIIWVSVIFIRFDNSMCRSFNRILLYTNHNRGHKDFYKPIKLKTMNAKFGKLAPKKSYKTLLFKNYVEPALAPPPAIFDILTKVKAETGYSIEKLFPMDGNDRYGCCTIAAQAHCVTIYNGMIGLRKVWSVDDVTGVYFELTGGPGIDTGLNELDVLNYWRKRSKDKILGFASVDVHNINHIKQAISLFGGVYIGFQVPDNCMQEFDAHQPWTPGKLTMDGHAVYVTSYDDKGVTVLTWGTTQLATWDWWNECVDEAYAILPVQATNPNFVPGLNLVQLYADINALAA